MQTPRTGREWLQRFERTLQRHDITCHDDPDTVRHLERQRAEAAYWPPCAPGQGGTLLLRESPSVSAVLEEIAHACQELRGRFCGPKVEFEELWLRREFEVAQCLDVHADRFGIGPDERRQTRHNLERYRRELAEWEQRPW